MSHGNTHQEMKIGSVQLNITDVERSARFYQKLLGLRVVRRYDDALILLEADGAHRISLDTWKGNEAALLAPPEHHGLYHFSIMFPDRHAFARVLGRLIDEAYGIDAALDFGDYEAIYLRDPDGIPVELYRDIPEDERRYSKEDLHRIPKPIDLETMQKEAR